MADITAQISTFRSVMARVQDTMRATMPATRKKAKAVEAVVVHPRAADQLKVKKLAYRAAISALAAKLALADGPLHELEQDYFLPLFFKEQEEEQDASRMFIEALHDNVEPLHYAKRIAVFFPADTKLYRTLFQNLCKFAAIDGSINHEEMSLLLNISNTLGLDDIAFAETLRPFIIPVGKNAYQIMEVSKTVDKPGLKKAFRQAVQAYHPDKMALLRHHSAVMDMARERLEIINRAYNTIVKKNRL